MITVFIVAAAPALRAGLRSLLSGGELRVVGESPLPTLTAADVVVAAGESIAVAARTLDGSNDTALVALSGDAQLALTLSGLTLRGWAITPEDVGAEELHAAVHAAAQGFVVLPRIWADQLARPRQSLEEPQGESLTTRELEVLGLLSEGLPNKQIAGRMQISEHTVKFHIASIFQKLGAASRTEAVSIGARRGMITL
ncbi:MAG: response regulator transcription factor [Oscillochloris sp.]|nr:response regulator transcription factor [Oscillochloris sp.]